MPRPRPDLFPAQRAVLIGWLRGGAAACAAAAYELEQGAAPVIDPAWLPKEWRFMLHNEPDAQEALW